MKLSSITFAGLLLALTPATVSAADGQKLVGTQLGTQCKDNLVLANAFDGDLTTCFHGLRTSDEYSRPWAGLDLGTKHVITRIGFAPSSESRSCSRLAIFQGANTEDFIDAIPIAMVPLEGPVPGQMYYIDVNVSRGFRYVRMVGAGGAQMNVAELEFYGNEGEGDDSQFFQITNLPTIAFNTPGMAQIVSKDDKHTGSQVYVISDDGTTLLSDNNATMKGRGNGSWAMEKKPFQIKFDKKKQILADAPAIAKKWTLINNHGDKTLMRNKIAFEMSRNAGMPYTSYCRFVDVVYNGEYEGTYQLCDQMEVNKNRVNITEMEPTDTEGEALTGGYFIEIDAYADQEVSWFRSNRNIPVTIKSPDEDEIVPAQSQYIEHYFNTMLDALFSANFKDEENGYRKYLDLDSFLTYFLLGELTGNTDTFWSTYMTKERGSDKFVTGPVWDQDLAFDNDGRTFPVNDKSNFIYNYGSKADGMQNFVDRIIRQDPGAKQRLSFLWSTLRKHADFTPEYFNEKIDQWAQELDQSQKLNFTRWPILGQYVHQNPTVRYTYEAEVNAVKNYITKRFPKLDTLIGLVDVPDDSAVESVETDTDAPAEYYNLQGVRVPNPSAGLYIERRGNTARKVILK